MNTPLHGPALITLATVVLLLFCASYVAKMRGRYGVKAPATTGHPQFEAAYRIQMNTLENTVVFLPALWLCAIYLNPVWASAAGVVWLVARIWYAFAYASDPKKRGGGFTLALIATGFLLIGAAVGVLGQLFAWREVL